MTKKPAKKPAEHKGKRKNDPWRGASWALLLGCVGELYLRLIYKYYIYGTLDQVLGWYDYLKVSIWLGLAVAALGGAGLWVWRRSRGWKRPLSALALGGGLFLAMTGFLVVRLYSAPITLLSVAVPAVAIMAILWYLYERECACCLSVLGLDLLVIWICRRGLGNIYWHGKVLAGAVAFLVCLATLAGLTRYLSGKRGLLGRYRLLPEGFDALPIYAACGIAAATTVLTLVSTAAAYYCFYGVAVLLFALAVYYAIRQL